VRYGNACVRSRFGIVAALLAVLALALPAFASADPLGSTEPCAKQACLFKSGLRSGSWIFQDTTGPEGNVWFTDNKEIAGTSGIGRIEPSGTIAEYISGTNLSGLNAGSSLSGITVGPDKKLWLTDYGTTPAIASIDPASPEKTVEETEFSTGLNAGSKPQGIVKGPDGNLWFADAGATPAIGRITPGGVITEFSVGLNAGSQPRGIVEGSDGNLWFTDTNPATKAIGKIDPNTQEITEFATGENTVPGGSTPNYGPWGITLGADGNVWFTDGGTTKQICKITTSGTITCYSTGLVASSKPFGLAAAPGGKLWFSDSSGITETQTISFSAATGGQEFKVCNEAESKCAKFKYTTVSSTATRTSLRNGIKESLEKIFGESVSVTGGTTTCGGNCAFTIQFLEEGPLVATDVGQPSCSPVTAGGTCSTGTTTDGIANAIGSITTSGTITRYPVSGIYSATGITYSGGNLWFAVGFGPVQQLGKFGIEPTKLALEVECTGSGSGSVEPVGCGSSAEYESGTEVTLTATASELSTFTGWTGCTSTEGNKCRVKISGLDTIKVTANFIHSDPPNNVLTLTKSGNGPGGTGSVSSKPKGIKCSASCTEAVASFPPGTSVELTAKPSKGSTFVEWSNPGGPCDGSISPVCTVPIQGGFGVGEEVGAVFTGTSKTITPAEALTLSKGEGSGKGTVKAAGLGCEAECTSTTVLYQGPTAKPGKVVILKEAPAFGSKFAGWTGCTEISETECEVKMESAKEVTAEYEALPNKVLTVNKAYAKGNGSVSSKPKGIKCGTACTQAVAQMPEGASVELIAKPSTGVFVKWEGGDCEGSTNPVCVVTMNTGETTTAVFSEPGKAIAEAKTLTLNKAGSAFGTVKAAGLGCEVLCSSTSVLYQGPTTKPGKVVILKAVPAPGSKAVAWAGCTPLNATECEVKMEGDKEVTATFDELE